MSVRGPGTADTAAEAAASDTGPDRLLRRAPLVCGVLLAVTLLHLVVQRCLLGASHSPTDLPRLWQFPAAATMRALPWQSVWYWHAYPSGFVAYWTLLINAFGDAGARTACQWIYLGLAAALTPMAYVIGLAVCGRRAVAAVAAVVVGASPTLPLFAAYFVYDMPTMALVTGVVACLAMHQLTGGRGSWVVAGLWLAGGVVLIRAMYHLALLLPLLVLLWRACPRRAPRLAGLGAVALPLAMYVKNYALFGVFASSSMLGFNYSKMVLWPLTPPEIVQFRRDGLLTPIVADYPLFYYMVDGRDIYQSYGYAAVGASDVLNQNNVNNVNLIALSREYGDCARHVLAVYPWSFVRSVSYAYWKFCSPPSRSEWFANNPARIGAYRTAYLNLVYAEWAGRPVGAAVGSAPLPSITFWLLPLVVVSYAARQCRANGLSARRWRDAIRSGLALHAAMAIIVYTTLTACLLEVNENDRYFTYIEPLFVLVTAAGLSDAWRRRRRRRSPHVH